MRTDEKITDIQPGQTIEGERYIRCDFSVQDLSKCVFIDCVFDNCTFQNAILNAACLLGCYIEQCDWRGCQMNDSTDLHMSTFTGGWCFTDTFSNQHRLEARERYLASKAVAMKQRYSLRQPERCKNCTSIKEEEVACCGGTSTKTVKTYTCTINGSIQTRTCLTCQNFVANDTEVLVELPCMYRGEIQERMPCGCHLFLCSLLTTPVRLGRTCGSKVCKAYEQGAISG